MAVRDNLTTDALSNTQWAEGLEAEVLKKISYINYIGEGSDSLCQKRSLLVRDAGDTIVYGLRPQDTPVLLGETDTYEGNEKAITTYDDSIVIGEIGLPYRWKTRMSRQRVKFEDREEARAAISDGMANGLDLGFFVQLAGFTATSGTLDSGGVSPYSLPLPLTMTGNNPVVAPDADHQIWADPANNTADEDLALAATDQFSLDLIDRAVLKAKTLSPAIRPTRVEGVGEVYVCFVHPYQVHQLRQDGSRWDDIQMAAINGGFLKDNPLLNGTVGLYNRTLLVESIRVPTGVDSGTAAAIPGVRRAIFCGAQAATIAWGRTGGDPGSFVWEEERFDFGRQRGIAASALVGLKKTRFNSKDFATIVISTYSDGSE